VGKGGLKGGARYGRGDQFRGGKDMGMAPRGDVVEFNRIQRSVA